MKYANKLQTLWIMWQTVVAILALTTKATLSVYFKKATPQKLDAMARRWAAKVLNIIKMSYTVFNRDRIKFKANRCYIIMCNHCSHYDIPLSWAALPGSIRMLAKKELFRIPVFGRAMKVTDFVSINRKNLESAKKELNTAVEKMKRGIVLWIAPEGTRSKTGKLLPFKKGGFMLALQTKAIIIPVGIRNTAKALPAKTWRFCTKVHAEVHVGKLIDAGNFSYETRDELMRITREEIAQAAGVSA